MMLNPFVQSRFSTDVQVFTKILPFEHCVPKTKYYEVYVKAFILLLMGMNWKENKQPEYLRDLLL